MRENIKIITLLVMMQRKFCRLMSCDNEFFYFYKRFNLRSITYSSKNHFCVFLYNNIFCNICNFCVLKLFLFLVFFYFFIFKTNFRILSLHFFTSFIFSNVIKLSGSLPTSFINFLSKIVLKSYKIVREVDMLKLV